MNRILLAVAAAALAAGCTSKNAKHAEAESPPFVFPHQPHVENDVACSMCHAGIEKATRLDPQRRHVKADPKSEACAQCHDKPPALSVPARTEQPFDVNFDHAAHLPRVNGDCRKCHVELPQAGTKHRLVPPMATCTSCHNHQKDFAQARCMPCHKDLKEYELKPVSAFAHEGDWLRNHGSLARPSAETCAQCHDQTYCADCHSATTAPARPSIRWPELVDREFIHRGDYVSRHMIDVAANPASCRRCHGSAFCQACHEQRNFLPKGLTTDNDPHPRPAWTTKGSGSFHGDAARSNIVACSGCHDQGSNAICTTCHRYNGPPPASARTHSADFKSKFKLSDANKPPCIWCHQ